MYLPTRIHVQWICQLFLCIDIPLDDYRIFCSLLPEEVIIHICQNMLSCLPGLSQVPFTSAWSGCLVEVIFHAIQMTWHAHAHFYLLEDMAIPAFLLQADISCSMNNGRFFHFGQCWLAHETWEILTISFSMSHESHLGSLAAHPMEPLHH